MVNASLLSQATPHFFKPLLSGFKSHLNIPVKFFSEHIEEKQEGIKTVTLRSEALEKTWRVKMEGQRFTEGWKEFVETHHLGIHDTVIFRHEGDMLFHVTALGPSLCEIQYTASGSRHQEDEEESGEEIEKEVEKNPTRFVKLTPTSIGFETGKQHLPASFTTVNGLITPGKIILVDKKGSEWMMDLKVKKINGSVYMYIMSRNGWRIFCGVNGVRAGESLTLELIKGAASPMLKFCSKTEQPPEARAHKRAKWSQETRPNVEMREKTTEEGEPSHRSRASNKTNANQGNLRDTQSCSVSDQMTKVKDSLVSTLTSIRRFREELKTKEQELEDSLQDINNLERRRQRE